MNFAALEQSSILFFNLKKSEDILSRWRRARIRASLIGKGLSKDDKAQILIVKHWLEAIDPLHRYGETLMLYYNIWLSSHSPEPFFYWLDVGDGKEVDVKEYPRTELHRNRVRKKEKHEVVIQGGKLVYKQNGAFVHTIEGTKWIYVLSTSRRFYVGQKERGSFQHSSFLAGAATVAAGRLVVSDGTLKAIWAYSGHYRPREENLMESIRFLDEQQVDLNDVKRCSIDDDVPPVNVTKAVTEVDSASENILTSNSELPKNNDVGKWIKSVMGLRKASVNEPEKGGGKSKKWRLWRSASGGISMAAKGGKGGGYATETEGSESSSCIHDGEMAAAVACFGCLNSSYGLELVRLQAIVLVRKQAAVTLKCMEALARVQARVIAQCAQSSAKRQPENDTEFDPVKQAENGWCDIRGTVDEVRSKLQMKKEGAIKRERALAYALSQQQLRKDDVSCSISNKNMAPSKVDMSSSGLDWLDRWMATKPWETKSMEGSYNGSSETTPISRKNGPFSSSSDHDSHKLKFIPKHLWNSGVTARQNSTKPNYMSLTKSIKAKQKPCAYSFHTQLKQMHSVEELPYLRKQSRLSRGVARTSADTDFHSVNLSQDLYHNRDMGRYGAVNSRDYYKQSNEF
ncbi:UNVERIFIED_CONTAM: IQ domain-containing protein IQM1 [Sesamum calycinum]|uniref:IQ domain-containing protein IQM1 n=1 Tax=Sesamum calycinum TaxID=2727403 RepID=A0AAW2NH78_9LAMI